MEIDQIIDAEVIPPHLNNTYIRPPGIMAPDVIKFDIPPTHDIKDFDFRNNSIHFTFNTSSNLLDPYSLYFNIEIINENNNPIQLDNSAHSLISSVTLISNGQVIEKITDYDFLHSLYFDMHLSQKQRSRRKGNEGFGDNKYGTNETFIPSKTPQKDKTYYEYINSINLISVDEIKAFNDSNLGPAKADRFTMFKNKVNELGEAVQVYDFYSKKIFFDNNIPDCKEWEHVHNGKLTPFPFKATDINQMGNKKNFKIPLMLKTIGFGQQPNNYKLVPLELFGILTVVIQLNPDAFFVPMQTKEYQYWGDGKTTEIMNGYIEQPKNTYKIGKCSLHTEQYRFSPSIHNQVMETVRSGGWVLDYIDMEIIDQIYLKNHPTTSYTKSLTRNNIKSIFTVFTNDLYKYSKYARKLSRLNKSVKNIFFKQAGAQYPPAGGQPNNSLCTFGKENCMFFYNELLRAMGKNSIDENVFIRPSTFAVNSDTSHAWGMYDYYLSKFSEVGAVKQKQALQEFHEESWWQQYKNQKSRDYIRNTLLEYSERYMKEDEINFNRMMDNVQNKAIFALNFETVPQSAGLYRTGINTSVNIPMYIELERNIDDVFSEAKENSHVLTFQWVIFEYFATIQLSPRGEFIRQ